MNAKQQYTEAYRVARLLKTVYATLKEQMEFISLFKWNFSEQVYVNAYAALAS